MSIVINGITCQEIARKDGLEEEFDLEKGFSARKGFLCAWNDRYTVAKGLLGVNSSSTIGGLVKILTTAQYPEGLNSYASRLSIEGVGRPSQGNNQVQWFNAIVWAHYKNFPWNFSPFEDQNNQFPGAHYIYAEQSMSSSVEWVTVPGRYTRFKTSGKPTGKDFGFKLVIVDMQITLHRLPYLPSAQVFSLTGNINSSTFLGVPTGQLVFNGCQTHETRSTDGTVNQDASFRFGARSQRWDYAFDGDNNRWDQVVWPDGSTPFLTSSDLSQVIPGAYAY